MNKNCFCNLVILKDFNSADEITIPNCDSEIDEIIESSCNVWIYDKKIIVSCNEYKLVLKGHKYIKTSYTTCDCDGRVYYSKLILPFFETISIPPCSNIKSITADVSYCDINVCKNILWVCTVTSIKIDYYLNLNNNLPKCLYSESNKYDCEFKNDTYRPSHKPTNNNYKNRGKGNSKYSKQYVKTKEPNYCPKNFKDDYYTSLENIFDNCNDCVESISAFDDYFSNKDITDDFTLDMENDLPDYLEAFDNPEDNEE